MPAHKTTTPVRSTAEPTPAQHALREHLRLLTAGRVHDWVHLFAADGVLPFPYAPQGMVSRVRGHDALLAHISTLPETCDAAAVDLRFHPLQDPRTAIAEFRPAGTALPTGKPYEQVCISVVTTDEQGLITHYADDWNPLAALEALGPDQDATAAIDW